MSEENVEVTREMFALVNERGVQAATDAFGHLLDPEFGLEEASNVPDRESYSGREAFIANMAKLEETFGELRSNQSSSWISVTSSWSWYRLADDGELAALPERATVSQVSHRLPGAALSRGSHDADSRCPVRGYAG